MLIKTLAQVSNWIDVVFLVCLFVCLFLNFFGLVLFCFVFSHAYQSFLYKFNG